MLSGVIAALTDIGVCELARRILGEKYVIGTVSLFCTEEKSTRLSKDVQIFLSLTSFFHGMSLTRSMSNSLETSLTTIALNYYPWPASQPFDG